MTVYYYAMQKGRKPPNSPETQSSCIIYLFSILCTSHRDHRYSGLIPAWSDSWKSANTCPSFCTSVTWCGFENGGIQEFVGSAGLVLSSVDVSQKNPRDDEVVIDFGLLTEGPEFSPQENYISKNHTSRTYLYFFSSHENTFSCMCWLLY